jgi:hypothetical protein
MRGVQAENVEKAIHFLAETDALFAEARTDVKRLEILRKRARARCYLDSMGSVAGREAQAEIAEDVVKVDDEYVQAVLKFERLAAQRERAGLVVDLYRTLESSRRVGAIK